jgi:hypothetical protein
MANSEVTDDDIQDILGGLPDQDPNEDPDDVLEAEDSEPEDPLGDVLDDTAEETGEESHTNGEAETEGEVQTSGEDAEEDLEGEDLLDEFLGGEDAEPEQVPSDPSVSTDPGRIQKLMKKAKKHSPDVTETELMEETQLVAQMEKLENAKSEIGFDQADLVGSMVDRDIWTTFGYTSFNAFFQSNETTISKSSAFRYRRVARFMEDFPIGEKSFDDMFYEETAIEKYQITDEDGNVDEERTRRENNLRRRLNFTDINKIATLYDRGEIDQARALELMKQSVNMLSEDFKEELQKDRDGNTSTITEELNERGVVGPTMIINASSPEQALSQLKELQEKIEEGEELSQKVLDDEKYEGVENIGSKKVSFYELSDGTHMIDI